MSIIAIQRTHVKEFEFDLAKGRILAHLPMATVQSIDNMGGGIGIWMKYAESLKFKFLVLILRLKN